MTLSNSPAEIVRKLLVDLSLGTEPSAGGSWPVYDGQVPDSPDDCIVVLDTAGVMLGRLQPTGEQVEDYGVQVTVRAAKHEDGYPKAEAISHALDQTVRNTPAVIGGNMYLVYRLQRKTQALPIGKEPQSSRVLFTINALVALKQTA